MRTAGGRLSKLFDVQNKKFTTVSCSACGFTEIYKGNTSLVGNVFDLMVGG
ncbi:MAG: zinc ribbon domain-containing protein [Candidatus Latescibacterota bacterium]